MPSDTFSLRLPKTSLVYPSHPEKFTEVIFGQFSSTLMSPIYVYWLCKCQPLLKKFSEYPQGKGRNLEKERSSEQHPPVILLHLSKTTLANCVHFPSTWMSPVWNRIDKAGRAGVSERGSSNTCSEEMFRNFIHAPSSHLRKRGWARRDKNLTRNI